MDLNMTVGPATCRLYSVVMLYSKHVVCVLRLVNHVGWYVWLRRMNLWLFMFNMHQIRNMSKTSSSPIDMAVLRLTAKKDKKTEPRHRCSQWGPKGPCLPENFKKYSHFVLWEAFF